MAEKTHIMLDLETLGRKPGCVVTAIGAVLFTKEGTKASFYKKLMVQPQLDRGLIIEAATMEWWLEQSDEARAEIAQTGEPVMESLGKLNGFINVYNRGKELLIWGNGATFDNVILEYLYDTFNRKYLWNYKSHRCYRTIKNEYSHVEGENMGAENASHIAVEDAMWQAKHLIKIHNSGNPVL